MKTLLVRLLLLTILGISGGFSQLKNYCSPLPGPNPKAPEPNFQLPLEIGDGFKFNNSGPDPYLAYVNVLATFVVIKRSLKLGGGPEMLWSDMSPRAGVRVKATFDLCDIEVKSFNNLPIGSFLVSLSGNYTTHAPIYGVSASFELGWFASAGVGSMYFSDNNSGSLTKFLTINPFFYEGSNEIDSTTLIESSSPEEKYYQTFTIEAHSQLLSNSALRNQVEVASTNTRWNGLKTLVDLQKVMTLFTSTEGGSVILRIVQEARNANRIDHLTVTENEEKIVHSILKGFCQNF